MPVKIEQQKAKRTNYFLALGMLIKNQPVTEIARQTGISRPTLYKIRREELQSIK